MSGLVEKVIEKVRGRSRSRSRTRLNHNGKSSTEFQRSDYADARQSQDLTHNQSPRVSSPTNPAWHVHKGRPTSMDVDAPPVPAVDTSRVDNTTSSRLNGSSHRYTNSTAPDNAALPSSPMRNRHEVIGHSGHETQSPETLQYPHTVPRRKESLPQNRAHHTNSTSIDQTRTNQPTYDTAGQSVARHDHGRHQDGLPATSASGNLGADIDRALADMSVSDRKSHLPASTNHTGGTVSESLDHMRLPQGFKTGHTEQTSVDTQWRPAVTHEHIYNERTEVVREAITRDIHVHHYYTYVQPIKVVEVLPVKHYRLDEKTGRKIEIAAPAGWTMPTDLRPRLEDTGFVKGWERHYLVNEQYPNGIPELPPSSTEQYQRQNVRY